MEKLRAGILPHSIFKNNDMQPNLFMTIILPLCICCQSISNRNEVLQGIPGTSNSFIASEKILRKIEDIPLPQGYKRKNLQSSSFAHWLRNLPLRADAKVYLYNGQLKNNQSAQFAVLDLPIGKKDLQQCADAIMRLRAQYLFDQKRFNEISFADNNGKQYAFSLSTNYSFESYLETVFAYCGTLSLERQMKPVNNFAAMEPGNILIKGGSPGHAVIIIDMAVNMEGKKIYLLAQSYMPAQDIHILKNPMNNCVSPWYELKDNSLIYTPEWTFTPQQLKKW
jgi:hypothetical protein